MAHLVALERRRTPRQRQAQRHDHQQAPQRRLKCVNRARAAHPEPHPAPHRARQAIAARAIDRELPEQIEECNQRNTGERLDALGLEADEKIGEIDRHQDRERDQEPDQQFLARPVYSAPSPSICGIGPEMAADVGGEPKPVKAEGHELQPGAALHQMKEFAPAAGKPHRHRRRNWRHETHLVHGAAPGGLTSD